MSEYETHQRWADMHNRTLEKLINLHENEEADSLWVSVIAYYKALHLVDAAAARESNRHFETHKERLEYLTTKGQFIKAAFDKLYILSIFAKYGDCKEYKPLHQISCVINKHNFIDVIQAWVGTVSHVSPGG